MSNICHKKVDHEAARYTVISQLYQFGNSKLLKMMENQEGSLGKTKIPEMSGTCKPNVSTQTHLR